MNQNKSEIRDRIFLYLLNQILRNIRKNNDGPADGKTDGKSPENADGKPDGKSPENAGIREQVEDLSAERIVALCEDAERHNLLPLMVNYLETKDPASFHPAGFHSAGGGTIPEGKDPDRSGEENSLQKYYRAAMHQVQQQMVADFALTRICDALSEKGIRPLVMKGAVCRKIYGEYGILRPSADEDLLIRPEELKEAQKILQANGYTCKIHPVYTTEQLMELQEITWQSDALCIELHLHPIGEENPRRASMDRQFREVFQRSIPMEWQGREICTMCPQDHMLFLILHAFKHMIDSGFGIRQVMDILLYAEKYQSEIDWNCLWNTLKSVRADAFFSDLLRIGNKWFGFELEPRRTACCPEELLSDILENGIFGNTTQAQQLSARSIDAALRTKPESENNKGKAEMKAPRVAWIQSLAILWKTAFPDRKYLEPGYPILIVHPFLLPIIWIRRLVRLVFVKNHREKGLIRKTMLVGKKRMELLKKYDLI